MPASLTASGWSQIIALDSDGYFDPVTFEAISDLDGMDLVGIEHASGLWVQGVDNIQTFGGAGGGNAQPAAIDAATNQKNLDRVAAQAAAELNLTGHPKSTWPINARVAYLQRFRDLVIANPDDFTDATWQIASRINGSDYLNIDPHAEEDVALSNYIAGVGESVKNSLPGQSVSAVASAATGILDALRSSGEALSTFSKFAPLLLGVAAIGVLYLGTRSVGRDPGGQASKALGGVRKILPY